MGAELAANGHKAWHDYRVVENLSFPIFHPDWGVRFLWFSASCHVFVLIITKLTALGVQADEEQLLLEAIEAFGLGNWASVAEHVGPGKSAAQCKVRRGEAWGPGRTRRTGVPPHARNAQKESFNTEAPHASRRHEAPSASIKNQEVVV